MLIIHYIDDIDYIVIIDYILNFLLYFIPFSQEDLSCFKKRVHLLTINSREETIRI